MLNYLILTSLILSNKTFNDQSYTLKTWYNISKDQLNFESISLKLLNSLEMHFLSTVNYRLDFNNIDTDAKFWNLLFANCHSLSMSPSVINFMKNYVTKDENSSPCSLDSMSRTPSTSFEDFNTTPCICTPKTSSSTLSTPGYKKLLTRKRTGKITKPTKVTKVKTQNHYPSPLKTISIPNSPALKHHQTLPNAHAKLMITPQISYSNSPNYALYYNDVSPICQRPNTFQSYQPQVVPMIPAPVYHYPPHFMYPPQQQHEQKKIYSDYSSY